ncbi:carboxypeptidase-like regulatory domain-containing protein [Hyalangium rubrum]|uniref:Carboxypeptidase-like regulatory domain-containing protein n=1 Tax=Hyalangium rubrum TaxID=3103134 RepID=A0ABU5GWE5_9BACT|nr:carboxypeptidase-like regulatory domain-containing protein [Hyalangium sp. s54d21]MDY7225518.1 carboxypeptidase-like regulatory domain-containing protein [Hyalangium sp. s54d21]
MRTFLRGVWTFWLAAALVACSGNGSSVPDGGSDNPGGGGGSGGLEGGVVKGLVVDTQGKPLQNLKVVVENTVFLASYVFGTTGQDGRYRVEVPNGSWKVSIQMERPFQGRTYKIDLAPENPNAFAGTEGAVRNFTWKLTGPRAEQDRFYGASVNIYRVPGDEVYFERQDVELTFTPDGPLIDGSTGQAVTAKPPAGSDSVRDIALGRYVITARLAPAGQTPKPMQLRLRNTETLQDSVTAIFNTPFPDAAIHELDLELKGP